VWMLTATCLTMTLLGKAIELESLPLTASATPNLPKKNSLDAKKIFLTLCSYPKRLLLAARNQFRGWAESIPFEAMDVVINFEDDYFFDWFYQKASPGNPNCKHCVVMFRAGSCCVAPCVVMLPLLPGIWCTVFMCIAVPCGRA